MGWTRWFKIVFIQKINFLNFCKKSKLVFVDFSSFEMDPAGSPRIIYQLAQVVCLFINSIKWPFSGKLATSVQKDMILWTLRKIIADALLFVANKFFKTLESKEFTHWGLN